MNLFLPCDMDWRRRVHATYCPSFEHVFSVNVLAGSADGTLTGPYVIANRLVAIQCADLFERILPLVSEDEPLTFARERGFISVGGSVPHLCVIG